jgi:hypothetical protein
MSNFWDILYLIGSSFLFGFLVIAYVMVLFHVIMDLVRDRQLAGGWKVLWLVGLIFVPMLTALIYIFARGKGMASRQLEAVEQARSATDAYIRSVGGKSPAEQIFDAKVLLDAGTIDQGEFDQLKAKALA